MEVIKIIQKGYCNYNSNCIFDDPYIVIPQSIYTDNNGNQIYIDETQIELENGEQIFITNQGLVICYNQTDLDGNIYTTTIDPDDYLFSNLFGYVQGNIFYYFNINETGV